MLEKEVAKFAEKMADAIYTTNQYARQKDNTMNLCEYGKAIAFGDILRDMCNVQIDFEMENPMARKLVRFTKVTVEGKVVTVEDKEFWWDLAMAIKKAMLVTC